jgi:hypothetical protein
MDSLRQTSLEDLADEIEPGDFLLEDTLSLHQTVERSFDPEASQPADWLNLSLRLEYEAQVVSEKDLQALVAGALDAELPDGFQAQPGPVVISHLSSPKVEEEGSARWRLVASRELQALASRLKSSPAKHPARRAPSSGPALAAPRIGCSPGGASPSSFRIQVTSDQ